MIYNDQRKWLTVKEKDKEHQGEDLNEQKFGWHGTKTLMMEQENGNEDKIINMSFFPKFFDWFTVQSKFQLAQKPGIRS